jgi:hypothetical protein
MAGIVLVAPKARPVSGDTTARFCPYACGGFVRRLPTEHVDAAELVAATSVHMEHSEPACAQFASASRRLSSRDETLIHVPSDVESLPLPLRRVLFNLWGLDG